MTRRPFRASASCAAFSKCLVMFVFISRWNRDMNLRNSWNSNLAVRSWSKAGRSWAVVSGSPSCSLRPNQQQVCFAFGHCTVATPFHSVHSVHGAQVHRCWSRTLHTTLVLWKQTDFQPPCSLRNLQRKFQILQKQSTLLSIAKDCLPTSFHRIMTLPHEGIVDLAQGSYSMLRDWCLRWEPILGMRTILRPVR